MRPKSTLLAVLTSTFLTLGSGVCLAFPVLFGAPIFKGDPLGLAVFCLLLVWMFNEFYKPAVPKQNEIREIRSLQAMVLSQPGTVIVGSVSYFLLGPTLLLPLPVRLFFLLLAIGGFLLRFQAMRALGRHYTMIVSIREGHELVSNGVYRFVRHPGYLGQFFFLLGYVIVLQSLWGLIMYLIWGATQIYRIQVEEKVLEKYLGETYREYQKNTKRLIPAIY